MNQHYPPDGRFGRMIVPEISGNGARSYRNRRGSPIKWIAVLLEPVRLVARWRRDQIAIRDLEALGDHHLRDIGIVRSQIGTRVKSALEKDTPESVSSFGSGGHARRALRPASF